MSMTQDKVFADVREIIAEALGVELDEVTPEARLTEDLGAESIDYLDIAFQLEKTFGITINPSELQLSNILADTHFVQEGRITDAGMAELRARIPQLEFDVLEQTRDTADLLSVFTADALVRFVRAKLDDASRKEPT